MVNGVLVEVCCGSVDDCITAMKGGADRIELNHALELDGMTPSTATLKRAKELVNLPICCMVRPRGYGFCYSEELFQVMKMEAKELLDAGADGIVFGFLHEDGTIDVERTKEMVEWIHPKEAIFHKAFDYTEDLFISMQTLVDCKVDRVLTSAKGMTPNLEVLKQLNEQFGDQIEILPGGGVRANNVVDVVEQTGLYQVHTSAKHTVVDPSTQRFSEQKDEKYHSYVAVDAEKLQEMMNALQKVGGNDL